MKDLHTLRVRVTLSDQKNLVGKPEVVTEEVDEENGLINTKTKRSKTIESRGKSRHKSEVGQRRKVHQSRVKNVFQDSAKDKKSWEVVLSESPEEKHKSQKVHPAQLVVSEDIIDLTGEQDRKDLWLSDLMKF